MAKKLTVNNGIARNAPKGTQGQCRKPVDLGLFFAKLLFVERYFVFETVDFPHIHCFIPRFQVKSTHFPFLDVLGFSLYLSIYLIDNKRKKKEREGEYKQTLIHGFFCWLNLDPRFRVPFHGFPWKKICPFLQLNHKVKSGRKAHPRFHGGSAPTPSALRFLENDWSTFYARPN